MDISKDNIRFEFYLDGQKYVVFSLKDELSFGDDLYFGKETENANYYDVIDGDEYNKVLKEYKEYLNFSEGGEGNED